MGSAYLLAGIFVMAGILKTSADEPRWAWLFVLAAACLIIAWMNEEGRGR